MSDAAFSDLFGTEPRICAEAPGRVNLIGEHTDYNGGFVLPAAIPLATRVELAPRPGSTARVWSVQYPSAAPVEFDVGCEAPARDWTDYVKGITWSLSSTATLGGFDARIDSRIPPGSGLSSSAALEIALARALREAYRIPLTDVELAVAARRAETDFVGAPVGIMDQMACSLADTDSALFIDTRTLVYQSIPMPSGATLVVIDSGISHAHADGDYRTRREECARAAAALGRAELRDVTDADRARIDALPEPLNRRARHVVMENVRVVAAVKALKAADLEEVGRLFNESHASMRDDFQISIPAIDALVERARVATGVYGARLTGGGFGGAIVALADRRYARAAAEQIVKAHNEALGASARVVCPI